MKETIIHIGLNDMNAHEQLFDDEKYINILVNVCKNYEVAFSVTQMNGGYFHDDGSYVVEKSMALKLIDVPDDKVNEIAKDLCVFFHQESVLITRNEIEAFLLSEKVE